jgi:hypothetical protein
MNVVDIQRRGIIRSSGLAPRSVGHGVGPRNTHDLVPLRSLPLLSIQGLSVRRPPDTTKLPLSPKARRTGGSLSLTSPRSWCRLASSCSPCLQQPGAVAAKSIPSRSGAGRGRQNASTTHRMSSNPWRTAAEKASASPIKIGRRRGENCTGRRHTQTRLHRVPRISFPARIICQLTGSPPAVPPVLPPAFPSASRAKSPTFCCPRLWATSRICSTRRPERTHILCVE